MHQSLSPEAYVCVPVATPAGQARRLKLRFMHSSVRTRRVRTLCHSPHSARSSTPPAVSVTAQLTCPVTLKEPNQPAVRSMARARGQEAYVARALTDRQLAPTAGDDDRGACASASGQAGDDVVSGGRARGRPYFT